MLVNKSIVTLTSITCNMLLHYVNKLILKADEYKGKNAISTIVHLHSGWIRRFV